MSWMFQHIALLSIHYFDTNVIPYMSSDIATANACLLQCYVFYQTTILTRPLLELGYSSRKGPNEQITIPHELHLSLNIWNWQALPCVRRNELVHSLLHIKLTYWAIIYDSSLILSNARQLWKWANSHPARTASTSQHLKLTGFLLCQKKRTSVLPFTHLVLSNHLRWFINTFECKTTVEVSKWPSRKNCVYLSTFETDRLPLVSKGTN